MTIQAAKFYQPQVLIECPECPGYHDSKTVFIITKFHLEAGRLSQYVCLPTIPNPKPLLKHDMTISPP